MAPVVVWATASIDAHRTGRRLNARNRKGFSAVAHPRHKRETNARRPTRAAVIVGPLAVLATASAVTLGVLAGDPAASGDVAATRPLGQLIGAHTSPPVTRSESRKQPADLVTAKPSLISEEAVRKAIKKADTHRYTTADLNLWSEPGEQATQLGELAMGTKVLVTGRAADGREEVVLEGKSRWVTEGYLSKDKLGAAAGLSMEPCPDPGVESGLTSNAVYVYRSVCHAFPQITSYGGWSNHGEHSSGRALDIMVSDVGLGTAIAEFLRAHASELHLYDVIWRQHIWTPERAGEGWRSMSSRGSATANHFDHVHVSTY
jgi:hypothetical protein